MKLTATAYSDQGPHRQLNEDRYLADSELSLFMVCDGVGGDAYGHVAAETAIQTAREVLRASANASATADDASLARRLKAAIQSACEAVQGVAEQQPKYRGMGTTLTAVLIGTSKAVMAHIGDSRLYLIRRNTVSQLSRDHTLAGELLAAGEISAEEAAVHPFRNVLTRAVGRDRSTQIELLEFDIAPGDSLLLCTDGVYATLESNSSLFKEDAISAEGVVRTALDRKTKDNATAVVITVAGDEDATTRAASLFLGIDALSEVYLFKDLTMDQTLRVLGAAEQVRFPAGSSIIRAGDEQSGMFIILQGEVEVAAGGRTVAHLTRGSHFGEMALLNQSSRTASVNAVSDSLLLRIEADSFRKYLRQEPQVGVELLWKLASELSRRLSATNELVLRY